MKKKPLYFSHDINARFDPKILAMRSVYGAKGYGWYWMLVEMMRESENYALALDKKYIWNAYAQDFYCKPEEIRDFVLDCINEFDLFVSEDGYFWSNTLRERMKKMDEIVEKRKKAANARWEKDSDDANAMHMHQNSMQKNANINININKKELINNPITPFGVHHKYQQCFGITSNKDFETINSYLNDGFDPEVIIEAFERTIKKAERPTFAYARTILNKWHDKKLHSLELVDKHDPFTTKDKKEKPEELEYTPIEPPDLLDDEGWT